jgi:hypothetical protein
MAYGFFSLTKWWNVQNTLEDDIRRDIEAEREDHEERVAESIEDDDDTKEFLEQPLEILEDEEVADNDGFGTDGFGEYEEEDEEPAPDLVDSTEFNVSGTVTGRTSCETPNYGAVCKP